MQLYYHEEISVWTATTQNTFANGNLPYCSYVIGLQVWPLHTGTSIKNLHHLVHCSFGDYKTIIGTYKNWTDHYEKKWMQSQDTNTCPICFIYSKLSYGLKISVSVMQNTPALISPFCCVVFHIASVYLEIQALHYHYVTLRHCCSSCSGVQWENLSFIAVA